MTRRQLVKAASAALPMAHSRAARTPSSELDFASALDAAEAIRRKHVSSVELTERVFARIDRFQPKLNTFCYQMREEAMGRAREADRALARGGTTGVLHGVPIHVKESFAVAGRPCTWGLEPLRHSRAAANSEVVDRLLRAGAVLIGATNVPVNLMDYQTYNPIYGTTNNPWDTGRTPGGSSGGSAAALAAGLGYLSVGSDIGGSIRVPAHFCGIYGHKPTLDLVDLRGHVPGGVLDPPGFSTQLAVGGPMARSAADLAAALAVMGGPVAWDAKAWSWKMPPPRGKSLKEFRVGFVLDDPVSPPTAEIRKLLEAAVAKLERAGAQMRPGWPEGFQLADLVWTYRFLLSAFLVGTAPKTEQEAMLKQAAGDHSPMGRGTVSSFIEWQRQNLRRIVFRAQWQHYFEKVDVFLSPVTFTPAFPHDHSAPADNRTIAVAEGKRPYWSGMPWIATASLTGCPATVAPVGRTAAGLPAGVQIMGPFWEDATPIAFAGLMAREVGGFTPPPGYTL